MFAYGKRIKNLPTNNPSIWIVNSYSNTDLEIDPMQFDDVLVIDGNTSAFSHEHYSNTNSARAVFTINIDSDGVEYDIVKSSARAIYYDEEGRIQDIPIIPGTRVKFNPPFDSTNYYYGYAEYSDDDKPRDPMVLNNDEILDLTTGYYYPDSYHEGNYEIVGFTYDPYYHEFTVLYNNLWE